MLLDSLKIQNFRALEDLEITQLGRVNLIVGKNNAGKSSILEAIEIYASLGSPLVLEEILERHNERLDVDLHDKNSLPVRYFFTGRSFENTGKVISIADKNLINRIVLTPAFLIADSSFTYSEAGEKIFRPILLNISSEEAKKKGISQDYLTIEVMNEKIKTSNFEGQHQRINFNSYTQEQHLKNIKNSLEFGINYRLVPTYLSSFQELSDIWDNDISLNFEYKAMVLEGLRIIEKEIVDLGFREQRSQRIPFVAIKGNDRPVSLNSMGDGVQRILQLLVSMVKVKNGFLLIDEFENGLHYSVQEKVWGLIFEWAEKLNIQVFATSHSWDCVKSFQKASQEFNNSALLFRLGRSVRNSNKGKVIATEYDKEKLSKITQAELEVR